MKSLTNLVDEYIVNLHKVLKSIPKHDIEAVGAAIVSAFEDGRQIFIAGNGGSAASASHMACDFAKTTLGKNHETISKRMRVIALSDNVPLITAWGNDVGYDVVFSEQLRNLANQNDLLIVISASGNSPNILECLNAAKDLKINSIGILGFSGGKAKEMCDLCIVAESTDYGIIEDAHMILNHILTAYFKQFVQSV